MTTRGVAWGLVGSLGALAVAAAAVALVARARAAPKLDAAQIVERSVAAHGGLEAWGKIQTLAWSGHVDRGGGSGPRPQFMLEQRRPNLTHFEAIVDGQRSVRVYDGRQGWKLRPTASGRPEVQPYTEEEQDAARDALVIDGPVMGAVARGVALTLEGTDQIEGRPAYRLSARLTPGAEHHVWVDASTFLEVKWDRPGRDAAGRPTTVAVYLRDYQAVEGLQLPLRIETGAPGAPGGERLVIERVAINPNLADGVFSRPNARPLRRGVLVDTRSAAAEGVRARPAAWGRGSAPSVPAAGAIPRSGSTP